jgi:hypothetical protein
VKHTDTEGEPIRGERTINSAEAEIIRRVFREFATGISPRAIARRFNDQGIPGPDGALWTDSTLRGHSARGTGLLNNELYVGKLVWNRLRYVKDPATGKRVSRINPRTSGLRPMFPSFASSMTRYGKPRRRARVNLPPNTPTPLRRPAPPTPIV